MNLSWDAFLSKAIVACLTLLGSFTVWASVRWISSVERKLGELTKGLDEKADKVELKELMTIVRLSSEKQADALTELSTAVGRLDGVLSGIERELRARGYDRSTEG